MTSYAVHINLDQALGLPEEYLGELRAAEARRAAQLAEEGTLLRLWRTPEESWGNFGLWEAVDDAALDSVLQTLPLYRWMQIAVTRISEHPSDPALHSNLPRQE